MLQICGQCGSPKEQVENVLIHKNNGKATQNNMETTWAEKKTNRLKIRSQYNPQIIKLRIESNLIYGTKNGPTP
jgi:hypothetical protein